ncbi:serine hydroxymethyltransferase [Sphaerisporangium sp. TRM90804]|uniref:serine hydroxymethyltransferase n=1 Tax=Sphaerisporangium sp. TRM90804 TaxID=3031113 RepID=UPI00244D5767|nr:serine hydroxymethyltransferase [Sphaerisporangium sp. TRM90804]MDH2429965.1 serine hydroxymethyltransferase [Sphaerisporangium sp. TRM90804]
MDAEGRDHGDAGFYGPDFSQLQREDPEIAQVLVDELERLRGGLQLIASENLASPAVIAALGSTLTNKYAEGYPGRRYYGGCEVVDRAERLAVDRAKELFGADHANVQPHSGASANLAAYAALLKPGDTVLAMALPHGGHLTHGSRVNFSGRWFDVVAYGVRRDTELIDYDEVRELAIRHRPKMIICGATAYPRSIDFAVFRGIADEVGAWLLADVAHTIGLVAGGAAPSPVPYADVVTFTTHKALRGPRGGGILCTAELASKVDRAVFPFVQGGPLMHAIAAKAVAFGEALRPAFRAYAERVVANARALADGLAAEDMRPVSGGTETHLALIDLRDVGVTGAVAEQRCAAAGITLNRNTIPYDPEPPTVTSGIRVGTPCVTTQGMGVTEMKEIAGMLAQAVRDPGAVRSVAERVAQLTSGHPAYPRG